MTRMKHKTFLRNEIEILNYCSTTHEMSLRDKEEHLLQIRQIIESTTRHSPIINENYCHSIHACVEINII